MNIFKSTFIQKLLFFGILVVLILAPQFSVRAAAVLEFTPITWNVIGLDSNNVNEGPNDFPVGVRICNTGDAPAANVTAKFNWDSDNANINLRTDSLDPITLASLPSGECADFYFEVLINRTNSAYDTGRDYHISISADGLTTINTPTLELYVEKLVSQNRNSVLDVLLDGVSIAAGGSMNLMVGETYTITLVANTATNGYEQIETFINFPNTIFQILSVATTYTADAGTDPLAYTKLYADGCGWDDATRTCTGTGKYGGGVTVTYEIKVIDGAGTSQVLNTLIYDFSGSSYHYNNDFSTSSRIANIIDPSACTQVPITSWQYSANGDTSTPTTGTGTFVSSGLSSLTTPNDGEPARSLSSEGWPSSKSTADYLEYQVSTVGYYSIHFNFHARYNNSSGNPNIFTGPNALDVAYSTSATPGYTDFATNQPVSDTWTLITNNLDSISALSNNANARFRIYAYNADNTDQLRVDNVTITGCQLPPSINLTKTGVVDQTVSLPTDETNVGDQVNYTLVITNTGGGNLTNITLTDDKAASLSCTPNLAGLSLPPGGTVTCTGNYTLTQTDFDAGFVTNIATTDSDQVGPVSDSTTQTLPQSPSMTVEKSSATIELTAPGTVTYSYLVTNTGNVTLTGISLSDDNDNDDMSCPFTSLAVGSNMTCTATHTFTQTELDANGSPTADSGVLYNLVTASSNEAEDATDFLSIPITQGVGSLKVTKVVDWGNSAPIPAQTFEICISGPSYPTDPSCVSLADGESATWLELEPGDYTVTETDPGSDWSVAGSGQVIAVTSGQTATATVTNTYTPTPPGSLQVTKVVDWGNSAPIPAQTFEICISGPSYPTDPSCVSLADGESATWLELEPGDYTITETDPGSDWSVVGSGQVIAVTSGQTATATVANTYKNPVVGLAKSVAAVSQVSTGTWEVEYYFVVENLGNVTLLNVQATDNLNSTFPLPTTFAVQSISSTDFTVNTFYDGDTNTNLLGGTDSLSVGATGTITVVVHVVPTEDGPFNNTATATAEDATGRKVSDISDDSIDPDPNGNGDPTEAGENDLTPVTFGPNLFDPPFGIKDFDDSGLPVLRWTMVWINDSNLVALNAEVSDPIPGGTTYIASGAPSGYDVPIGAPTDSSNLGVSCTPDAASVSTTTTLCYYEGPTGPYPRGRIIWQGTLGPDFGAVNASEATNEISISFTVDVPGTTASAQNIGTISADLNGDGNISGSNEISVASAQAIWSRQQVTELPATGFAPGEMTLLPVQPLNKAYQALGPVWLEIPALGVRTNITGVPATDGEWDVSWLNTQAGWLQGTAFPSFSGNSVLTGHVVLSNGEPGPFVNLGNLRWNNTVVVHAFGMRYIYKVQTNQIIQPDDLSALQHEEQPWISLITCRGYDEATGTYDFRVLVRAVLVDAQPESFLFE